MKESVRRVFDAVIGGHTEDRKAAASANSKILRIRERLSRPQSLARDALFEHAQKVAQEQFAVGLAKASTDELSQLYTVCVKRVEQAHIILSRAAYDRDLLTPGAEWLLDNYHIIQEQIASIKRDFPRGYDKTLPKLASGKFRGYPRVYEIALELLSKSDSVVDGNLLSSFISGYQSVSHLTLGEFWAVPIMLRFALVEHIAQLAERFVDVREERKVAEQFIDEIIGDETRAGTDILLVLASKIKDEPRLLSTGAPYLLRRLRERGKKATITLQWLEERLREQGAEPEEILRNEQYALAADQISIGNSITSLKAIGYIDWKSWVESASLVEKELRSDPTNIYQAGDFKTRDKCRHVIELLAKRANIPELEVAQRALKLAQIEHAKGEPEDETAKSQWKKRASVTFYLLKSRQELTENLKIQNQLVSRIEAIKSQVLLYWYLLSILVGSMIVALWLLRGLRFTGLLLQICLFILAVIPASEIISNILQWIIIRLVRPAHLPKLDYQLGIPPELKTVVIVHSLFADMDTAISTTEGLEVRFLANADPNLTFGILADLKDGNSETLPDDEDIIRFTHSRIEEMNDRHGHRFFVLFRKRKFNAGENKWMAWERKRGKLEQFNQLILDSSYTGDFLEAERARPLIIGAKYVLTLDNDSQLPRGSVQKLVGTAAHPLNTPIFSEKTNQVEDGYSIIQPRVGTTITSANRSLFAKVFAAHAGLDPYSETVSEVYQDLFGEGSFIGKGLYDVKAFHKALADRVPENSLLSHDLFEGNYCRVGLATDIELYDDYPSKYHVHARRQHRWARGDWQLLPWLFPKVPTVSSGNVTNTITALGKWKIFDNLRRSLVAPMLFFGLFLSWIFLAAPYEESLFALLVIAFPVYANLAQVFLIPTQRTTSFKSHVRGMSHDLIVMSKQALFTIAMLPHQTVVMCDAIFRTLYRLLFSRQNLLEWETAYHSDLRLAPTLNSFIREMGAAVALVLFAVLPLFYINPRIAFWHSPVFVLWLISPAIAYWVSRPIQRADEKLDAAEKEYLRNIAWKTWRYFRELINEENNYLVPDNIQLIPKRIIAQRTSPTNISLSLLSAISAYKLGFYCLGDVVERMEKTFASLAKLERFRGHFLNWYDCVRMAPLLPRYVSTVDSGNFVGHLIAVRSFLRTLHENPLLHEAHSRHAADLFLRADLNSAPLLEVKSTADFLRSSAEIEKVLPQVKDVKIRRDIEDLLQARKDLIHIGPEELNLEPMPNRDLQTRILRLIEEINRIIAEHDFQFLYDADRDLFAIGYHVDNARRDQSFYDILASEARLSGLVAIALGQVPERHWFALGRALADSAGGQVLLSWSGTMFEYLMPVITTKDYFGTILSESYKAVIKTQQAYAASLGVPWGISESSFSGVDFEKTYQYRAFGVPGLGLKRGLEDDVVVSPYSTALALLIYPKRAIQNFKALEKEDALGEYGFYEAIDYTKTRLAADEEKHVVQNFFAHHQGMSLCAMANVLCSSIIQELFHADPLIKATELLLQERFPDRVDTVVTPALPDHERERDEDEVVAVNATILDTPHTAAPRTHLLSNGRYSVMVDNAGSGFSVFERDLALSRWREDALTNQYGTYIYLKDRRSRFTWSATYQPTCVEPESYEVFFSSDKAEFKRRDRNLVSHTQIAVSPEDNVEIRKLTLINLSAEKKTIEVTSYGEVALNFIRADQSHPAFSKMFIQSDFLPEFDCLIFSRRPRSASEKPQYFFHMLTMKTVWERVDYDSSRFSFIGRGRSAENPVALEKNLTGSKGSVLDPVFSLRTGIEVNPGHAETLNFVSGYAATKEELMQLVFRYKELHQISRAYEMAWSQASVEIRNEQVSANLFPYFQRMANALLFNFPQLRGGAEIIQRNRLTQQNLWRFGVSGDLPIVLTRITESNQVKLVQELLACHSYLRQRGVSFDLIILNEYPGGYLQILQEELDYTIKSSLSGGLVDRPGGVFLRSLTQMSDEERELLTKVARVVLNGTAGLLQQQLKIDERPLQFIPKVKRKGSKNPLPTQPREFDNSYGGFIAGGRGYALTVSAKKPPLPYANVVANPKFGFLVTESGGGYTWSENSRENRLTSWSNDAISDPVYEVAYIRDTDSGEYWSATPDPAGHGGEYRAEHHFGFSSFSTQYNGIESELHLSVANSEKIKFYSLQLHNRGKVKKRLELIFYTELVLGVFREESSRFHNTVFDPVAQALFVSNSYNGDFPGRVVAIGANRPILSFTANRVEFIGRNRSLRSPIALDGSIGRDTLLSRKTGAGFDPCAALHVEVEVPAGKSQEVLFFMAEYNSAEAARVGCAKLAERGLSLRESAAYRDFLNSVIENLQVQTPERSFDLILNGWLLYQLLTSRLYGRTGLYQSGGAFGFRDQLQDVLALLYSKPELAREQLLLHASRQFPEGDVQHWWHPPSGKGVRTKISDDFLWMPFVAARYIEATGDLTVLDEQVAFIDGHVLGPDEHEAYIVPRSSEQKASFYEHCVRAIEKGLHFGSHNLPLMGVGDWNDGMNEVGKHGQGESVWLAWFLALTVKEFLPIVEARATSDAGELNRLNRFQGVIQPLVNAVEENAWDGQWYRRAYFDDGTPLGSQQNDECQIDSLPQTWSVLSELGRPERQKEAMELVYQRLVDEKVGVIKLFDPPFDQGTLQPGYIKGYLPGVRENGGQYTHAAVWVVMAAAKLGDGDRALRYFQLINPVTHNTNKKDADIYMGEPYVLCGDVYAAEPFVGRAGWSWYTGSAGWLYQAGISDILGLKLHKEGFTLKPCIPSSWPGYKMEYKKTGTKYIIEVVNGKNSSGSAAKISAQGADIDDGIVRYKNYVGVATVNVKVLL